MRPTWKTVLTDSDVFEVSSDRVSIGFSRINGKIRRLAYPDGNIWVELLHPGTDAGDSWNLPVTRFDVVSSESTSISTDDIAGRSKAVVIEVEREDDEWSFITRYELHPSGYLVADFVAKALEDGVISQPLSIGVPLSDATVLANEFRTVNLVNDRADRRAPRALGVDFSTDERPVTGSVNLLLETVGRDIQGGFPQKQFNRHDGYHLLCWDLGKVEKGVSKGTCYKNRWGLSITSLSNEPNPVRGQRIYHWYGRFPCYPADDLLVEMAEYGCSILIMHMPAFSFIAGSIPADPAEMKRVVTTAHGLGIKVLFYCVPQLISKDAPYHDEYAACRTEGIRVWHSLKETQIVFYEEDTTFDADELCLRSPAAYDFVYTSVLDCYKKYSFDGIYIDYAWPAAGLCSNADHDHDEGCYNFFDYWRILREWREAVGDDALMIGHGGGLLVSSDMVEGFDACLTGEAQSHLDPVGVGQHIGLAPTLWGMHRRKQDVFRSARTIPELVREGMTPHVGLGVLGTSVIASFDPAHHHELLPLWQMWRAFPVERARIYTYLQPGYVTVDNDEVVYSLFVTEYPYVLLIVSNGGGPFHDANPSVGVTVNIDCASLNLPAEMHTWRMKGDSYETFRIEDLGRTNAGSIDVPELLLYETVGFILSPYDPPVELVDCMKHLEGRWSRLADIGSKKVARLAELDANLDSWARLPAAKNTTDYASFMKNRLTE